MEIVIDIDKLKHVIFDLDGTIIDNMMYHHLAWQKTLDKLGKKFSIEHIQAHICGGNSKIIESEFPGKFEDRDKLKIANEKETLYRKLYKTHMVPIAGFMDFTRHLNHSRIDLHIATASPQDNLSFVLNTLNIRTEFKILKHSGDVKKSKPDPEIYLSILNELKTDASETIVFEDSPTGVKSCANANLKAVVVLSTHKKADFKGLENSIIGFINDYNHVKFINI